MKKLITVLFSVLMAVPAYAHAGGYDQFLEQMVSYRALLITVLFVHVTLWACVKLLHNRLPGYKRILRKVVRLIKRKKAFVIPVSWILSSFVLGIYLMLLCNRLFVIVSLILSLIYIFAFPSLFLRKNWRRRFIIGVRPLYCYIQSAIFISVGLILYYILWEYEWFRSMLSYTTEEYMLTEFYLFPKREVVYSVIKQLVLPLLINAIPYVIYSIVSLSKCAYRKLIANNMVNI